MHAVAGKGFVDWLEGLTVGEVALVVVVLVAAAGWVKRKLWPTVRDVVLGLVDIVGAPARNGRPARPGLLEHVELLAAQVSQNTAQLERLDGLPSEVAELREGLARVEETATTAASSVVAVEGRVQHVSEQIDEVKASVDEVKDAQLAKAAELTQIRQTLEAFGARVDETHGAGAEPDDGPIAPTTD